MILKTFKENVNRKHEEDIDEMDGYGVRKGR